MLQIEVKTKRGEMFRGLYFEVPTKLEIIRQIQASDLGQASIKRLEAVINAALPWPKTELSTVITTATGTVIFKVNNERRDLS